MPFEAWQCLCIYCVQCEIVKICPLWCHIIIIIIIMIINIIITGILFIPLFLDADMRELHLRATDDDFKIPAAL